ncbi:DUF6338 family protein [Flavihalobacter algicola]|uniref:DUF6338 family protein n=2 Tax=Psychroserpens algicola TaxID=1719034 RepID=A0ABT0H3U7_9FLAO|nr:DUF6338 family protein [Psychroserpens algicola]
MYRVITLALPVKSIEITSKTAIEVITYGTVNYFLYILMSPYFFIGKPLISNATFFFLTPVLLALLISYLLKSKLIRKVYDVAPTPWDFLFMNKDADYVIIELKDGSVIGGHFGLKSRATEFPREKEIFVEKEWVVDKVDEKLLYEVPDSKGLWVNGSEIKTIKLF